MSEQNQQIYRELMNSGIDFPWISSTVRSIQPLLEGAVEITLKKGDILYDESYDGRYVYVVKSGRVGNYFITSDGHEKLVGIFVKGSLLGEMHVLDEKSGYYISQVTSRQATLYQVTRETFLQKLQEIPSLTWAVFESLSDKIRVLSSQLEYGVYTDAATKIAFFLLSTCKHYGVPTEQGYLLDLDFTHRDLAWTVGLSRVSVSNQLLAFQAQGVIGKLGKRYVVYDLAFLWDMIHG